MDFSIAIKRSEDMDLYDDVIMNLFESSMPGSIGTKESKFEALFSELMGTKQHRNGPIPTPEVQVSIRNILRENDKVLQILVPWGGSKQGKHTVDIAELYALRQLTCLKERLKKHGMQTIIHIRLEDLTDQVLFFKYDHWFTKTKKYCQTLSELSRIVDGEILVFKESDLLDAPIFFGMVEGYTKIIFEAMQDTNYSKNKLKEIDWSGELSEEQISYYRTLYKKLYSNLSYMEQDKLIADYFACALTRKKLNGQGISNKINYLTLCFNNPIPGVSRDRRVFYRTIPERYTNKHTPPWMGKGYLRIEGNCATPAIDCWNTSEKFNEKTLIISSGNQSIEIQSDYLIKGSEI